MVPRLRGDKLNGNPHLELIGHKSVETTIIYTHAIKRGGLAVRSPLDTKAYK
jgi:hypothetical protein